MRLIGVEYFWPVEEQVGGEGVDPLPPLGSILLVAVIFRFLSHSYYLGSIIS
jgi:hypothetical protein